LAPRVLAFIKAKPLDALYVGLVTLTEFRFGIEFVADVGHRTELSDWLASA
jgi:hypothetical protein